MSEEKNSVKYIILGVIFIVIGVALFIAGIVTISSGLWYLMFIGIPFFPIGIVIIMLQAIKPLMAKIKARNIELLKEIKHELSSDEFTTENLTVCLFCGTTNDKSSKFCKTCGKQIVMVCPHCGAQIFEDSIFCNKCGGKIE